VKVVFQALHGFLPIEQHVEIDDFPFVPWQYVIGNIYLGEPLIFLLKG